MSFRIITFFQKDSLKLYYNKSSALMRGLMKNSKIKGMTYVPHTLALNGHMQAVLSMICEIYLSFFFSVKYEREMFCLSDGGTIALDWVIDHEGGAPRKNSHRPILCCFSGLSGGNKNVYLYSMIKSATQAGFKCVVVNFRGCSGVKLTSPKIYWKCNWTDVKEPIEYIHAQYCSGENPDFMQRNLYAYAVSLGAGMLTKYLFMSGDKCVLSGALPYALFYEVEANVPFFKSSGGKFYDFALGYNYYNVLKA